MYTTYLNKYTDAIITAGTCDMIIDLGPGD